MLIAIFTTLIPYMADSVQWEQTQQPKCYTYWWANLLYINNLIDGKHQVCYFQYPLGILVPIRGCGPEIPFQFFSTFGPVAACCVINRKSPTHNGPRSMIMLVAMTSGYDFQHHLWLWLPVQIILPCINVCTELPAENRIKLDWKYICHMIELSHASLSITSGYDVQYRVPLLVMTSSITSGYDFSDHFQYDHNLQFWRL